MSAETSSAPPRSRIGCWLALVLIALILAALAAFIFLRIEAWPGRAARAVREAFAEIAPLQPRVTIRDRVVFEQTAATLELTVVTRDTEVERETEHEWLGSKKRIRLRGTYRVRAGFDLTKPFNVRVTDGQVLVEVPPPKILSVDQVDVEVLALQNGIWNKIRPDEIEAELRTLPQTARLKAADTGLPREALEEFTRQLREKLAPRLNAEVRVLAIEPEPARHEGL